MLIENKKLPIYFIQKFFNYILMYNLKLDYFSSSYRYIDLILTLRSENFKTIDFAKLYFIKNYDYQSIYEIILKMLFYYSKHKIINTNMNDDEIKEYEIFFDNKKIGSLAIDIQMDFIKKLELKFKQYNIYFLFEINKEKIRIIYKPYQTSYKIEQNIKYYRNLFVFNTLNVEKNNSLIESISIWDKEKEIINHSTFINHNNNNIETSENIIKLEEAEINNKTTKIYKIDNEILVYNYIKEIDMKMLSHWKYKKYLYENLNNEIVLNIINNNNKELYREFCYFNTLYRLKNITTMLEEIDNETSIKIYKERVKIDRKLKVMHITYNEFSEFIDINPNSLKKSFIENFQFKIDEKLKLIEKN